MELISAYYVAWITDYVFTWRALPQVWRFVTPFFITGPKFGLLMDPYFLWTYASQLELEASRFSQPGDFFTYITFVCSVIMVSDVPLLRPTNAHTFFSFFKSAFPLQHPPPLLPFQLILAETVPKWEGYYPCTVWALVIRKINRAFRECGHGGISLEKAVSPRNVAKRWLLAPTSLYFDSHVVASAMFRTRN
jgi:hypothetical protein